jgi:hypothetical protein
MSELNTDGLHDAMKGLHRDSESGNYRVESGYGYQAHRYRIDETWLDEEDNLWVKGDAVERESGKAQDERK